MKLSDVSISRPVFASVMSLVIILLGLVGYRSLSVREYPNIDEPTVSVTTTYSGADADIMENQVTKPMEDNLAGIEGIKYITSTSREGASLITITFQNTRNADSAAADVRDRVSRARGMLPDDVDEPVINKVEADSSPIIYLVLKSDNLTPGQLSDLASHDVKDRVQTISGIADVNVFGTREYAMRVWLDPVKLAAYNLVPADIEKVLTAQNVDIPSGRLQGSQREFTVRSNTDVNTVDEFRNLVVSTRKDTLGNAVQVRLGDVATVNAGAADETSTFRYNGAQTVALGLVKQATANPLEISTGLKKVLPTIQERLPHGVTLELANDTTVFISKSIENVYHAIRDSIILVIAVIWLFLRSGRATLIPLVTIPVSLIGTFFLMQIFGFSINTLTLLAMVLAVGLVVDDAIVVLENIYRHIENGMKPMKAARLGAAEIGFPVVAMTLTLAAVYVPIAFMEGRTGKLFTEFAITLASSVIISGFAALTISPMMCARFLNSHTGHGPIAQRIENVIEAFENGYARLLNKWLGVRILVWPLLLVFMAGIGGMLMLLKSELSPIEDRGLVFTVLIGPEGATSDYMAAYAEKMTPIVKTVPEIDRFGFITGVGSGRLPLSNQGFGFLRTVDWDDRDRNTIALAQELMGKFMGGIPGILAIPLTPPSLGAGVNTKPVNMVLKDNRPYPEIAKDLQALRLKLAKVPSLAGVDDDLKINTPQMKVIFDRQKLADLGISPYDAGHAVELLLAARSVTRFKYNGEQYDVMLQAANANRIDAADLERTNIRTGHGDLVPLSTVAKLEATTAPRDLNRYNRSRSVTITANIASGYALSDALPQLEQAVKDTFPSSTRYEYSGQTLEFQESGNALVFAFCLAIVFIFLVLAAQFESFVDPVIILTTVPMTILGALLTLWATGNTLNIYSEIGLITLVGLISKHGILLVEFANHAVEQGKSRMEAMKQSTSLRLRPIVMTTFAMVLGAVPLAIATGAGAESRQQLGWVIVGGMTFGTMMTLFVLPALYTFLPAKKKLHEEEAHA
jgi:multidrug efflux pump